MTPRLRDQRWPETNQTWPQSVPTLIDPHRRVSLRAHRDDDLPRIVEMCNDPDWVQWTPTPWPYDLSHGQEFLHHTVPSEVDAGRAMIWAIEAILTPGGEPEFCGTVEIRRTHPHRGEIAFGLHPTARGQSLMSRAGRLALDWAFDVAGFPAVEWNAMVGNWASRQVAAALGFRFEGVRRAYLPYREWLKDCWTATALATGPRCSVTPAPQPVVRHAGMVLRPFRAGDLQQVVSACADPLSQRWLGHLPAEFGPAQARDFLADCWEGAAQFDHWTWCITTAGDDRCAGAITLFGLREQAATGEIGYWLHPQARGRGLAKTAARTVVDLALGEFLGHVPALTHTALMHSLVIRVPVDNRASHAVARATGARIVGRLPQAELLRSGDWTDLVVYSRVRGRAGQPAPHAR